MNSVWNDLYGQENAKLILNNIIESGKVPHAFLFSGQDGIGKEYCALKFVEILNRHFDPSISEANLKKIYSFSEPYVKYIIPLPRGKNENEDSDPFEKLDQEDINLFREEIAKKKINPYYKITLPRANNIKINSIRDIKYFLSLQYSEIKYRVIIISDAHLMSEGAQNALLKSLEEPPAGVIFILTTRYPGSLRETTRSRCWNINFQPLDNNNLENLLVQMFKVNREMAKKVVPFSSGSSLTALKLLDNNIDLLLEKTINILRNALAGRFNTALEELNILIDNDAKILDFVISLMIFWFMDVQKDKLGLGDLYYDAYKETIQKFNKNVKNSNVNDIIKQLEVISGYPRMNINQNLILLKIVTDIFQIYQKNFKNS